MMKYMRQRVMRGVIGLVLMLCCVSCTGIIEAPARNVNGSPKATSAGPVKIEVVAAKLDVPWGLAFLPDGSALVSERDSGKILALAKNGETREVQRIEAPGSGEGGLLGIAVAPDYAQSKFVYAYVTAESDNRVLRFRLGEQPQAILTGIPSGGIHNGGRIAFGLDGLLYIGTGDAGQGSNAQDTKSLGGKILRIKPDGGIPSDNPFKGSPVYSYGHRNVQGLTWDAQGQLYASEFGQNTFDEVNRIVPGGNYGWPEVEGVGGNSQYMNPVTTFATSEASPSGAVILHRSQFAQWEGNVFVAGLGGRRLWRLALAADGKSVVQREALLEGEYGRLRHVTQAPDGSLWVLTNNRDGRGSPSADDDYILRLVPAPK